jgi:hypothetical protein
LKLPASARLQVPALSTQARRRWRTAAQEILPEVAQSERWSRPSTLRKTEGWLQSYRTEVWNPK